MADTFATYADKLSKLEKALSGPEAEKLLHAVGKAAKADATEAVQADLGDRSMSHWRRGSPIELAARYDVKSDSEVEVLPTPRSRGPWRVMEDGRRAGSAYDLVQVGKRRKDGTRRGKSRGRNSGATQGKNTWTEASALMEQRTPERVQEEHVKVLRGIF